MIPRLRNLLGCQSDDAVFTGGADSGVRRGSRPVALKTRIQPQAQPGHMCKTVAIAHIEAHYADKYSVERIPLLKERAKHEASGNAVPQFSVRKLAKEHGSAQGEILECGVISKVAARMGYTTVTTKPATVNEFENFIRNSITRDAPVFACFPVNHSALDPNFGSPADYDGMNEHAAVIVAHDPVRHTVDMVHWGATWPGIPSQVLLDKMRQLPDSREQEVYRRIGASVSDLTVNQPARPYKYDLVSQAVVGSDETLLHSISPRPGTGFKNALMSMHPDSRHARWQGVIEDSTCASGVTRKRARPQGDPPAGHARSAVADPAGIHGDQLVPFGADSAPAPSRPRRPDPEGDVAAKRR